MEKEVKLALAQSLKNLDELIRLLDRHRKDTQTILAKVFSTQYLIEGCLVKLDPEFKSKSLNTYNLQDIMGKPVKAEKKPQPQCVVKPLDGQVSKKDGVSK